MRNQNYIHCGLDRIGHLQRAFISLPVSVEKKDPPNGKREAASLRKPFNKRVKYIRSDTLKVKVFAYINPFRLQAVDQAAAWYEEYKVIKTDQYLVIALVDGYKVQYNVQVYTFRGISAKPGQLEKLLAYIQRNPDGRYKGWIHHANIYFQVSKQFKEQIILNYFL